MEAASPSRSSLSGVEARAGATVTPARFVRARIGRSAAKKEGGGGRDKRKDMGEEDGGGLGLGGGSPRRGTTKNGGGYRGAPASFSSSLGARC